MTFQAPDRFSLCDQGWYIHSIRGEAPRALSHDELGIESRRFESTALYRGRIDLWGVEGRQLVFLGAMAGAAGETGNNTTPQTASCEFLVGRNSDADPYFFENYRERLVLGFTGGLLTRLTVVEDADPDWARATLRDFKRQFFSVQKDVEFVLSQPMNILGCEVHGYQIHETFELERGFDSRFEAGGIEALADFAQLRRLGLEGFSRLEDIAPLANLTELRRLSIARTSVASVASLAELRQLEYLDLSETSVNDLAPLAGCTALRYLDLRNSMAVTLRGIGALPRLQTLLLGGCRVQDLSPLHSLDSLRALQLDEEQLNHRPMIQDLLALRATHPDLVFGIETHAAPDARVKLELQTGYNAGKRVITPFVDREQLLSGRIPAFSSTVGEFLSDELDGAIQVRSAGEYVFWIPPSCASWEIQSFPLERYQRIMEKPIGCPPRLCAADLAELLSRYAAVGTRCLVRTRGSGLLPSELQMQCSLDQLFGAGLAQLSFVEPPRQFAQYASGVTGTICIGGDGDQLSILVPGLPAWVTSATLAEQLFSPVPVLRSWPELLGGVNDGSQMSQEWNPRR